MSGRKSGLPASVAARLLNRAKQTGDDYADYKDSGVEWEEVPENWEVKRLKFVVPACGVFVPAWRVSGGDRDRNSRYPDEHHADAD